MPIVRAAESPRFELDGFHFFGLTAPSRGAAELCTWRLEIEPGAGVGGEFHRLDHEEVFIGLEGTVTVDLEGEHIELSPGDALAVPARQLMRVSNTSGARTRTLVCVPAGIQAVFADGRAIGTPPWAQ